MRRAVVFDMDGTLLRLPVDIEEARLRIAAHFASLGVEGVYRPVLRGIHDAAGRAAAATARPAEEIEKEARAILDGFEVQAAGDAVPRDGVAHVVGELQRRGVVLGLLTDNGRACVAPALTRVGLSPEAFAAVSTRDDVAEPKPHPEGLVRIARSLGGDLLWYVGDHPKDLHTAAAARPEVPALRAAGLAGGFAPKAALRDAGADAVIDELAHVLGLAGLEA